MKSDKPQQATNKSAKNEGAQRQSWDEYFTEMCALVASRSRDDCPVGVVIVGEEQVVLATGYNGLPRKVSDLEFRFGDAEEKLRWVVHAEANAICNAARVGVSLLNSTLYVNKFPCAACAGAIVQAGVQRLVTEDDHMWRKNPTGDRGSRALRILMEAGVEIHAPYMKIGEVKDDGMSH